MRALVSVAVIGVVALSAGVGTARAGCAAEVELRQPPQGLAASEPWTVDILVLQHGITPLADAFPRIEVVHAKSGERRAFAARPTDERGVYRAVVAFPSAGSWRYAVYDGFAAKDGSWSCARTHHSGSVTIARAGAADASGGRTGDAAAALGALAAAASAVALVGARRRRAGARRFGRTA